MAGDTVFLPHGLESETLSSVPFWLGTANGELKGSATPPLPQGLMRYTMVLNKVSKETKIVLFQATPVVPSQDCRDGNCAIR